VQHERITAPSVKYLLPEPDWSGGCGAEPPFLVMLPPTGPHRRGLRTLFLMPERHRDSLERWRSELLSKPGAERVDVKVAQTDHGFEIREGRPAACERAGQGSADDGVVSIIILGNNIEG
jgi:hypothetical protein